MASPTFYSVYSGFVRTAPLLSTPKTPTTTEHQNPALPLSNEGNGTPLTSRVA